MVPVRLQCQIHRRNGGWMTLWRRKWGWTSTQLRLNHERNNLGRLLPGGDGALDAHHNTARLAFVLRCRGRRLQSEICLRFHRRTLMKATGAYGQHRRDPPPTRLHIVYPTGQLRYYLLLRKFSTVFHSLYLSNLHLFTVDT